MEFGKILNFGIFDSKKKFINTKITPLRNVEAFEFEYIISCDKHSISYIDDVERKIIPQTLIFRKPGQTCQSKLNFKCYYIHLQLNKDSSYYSELSSLPSFSYIQTDTYRKIFESFIRHNITDRARISDEYSLSKLFELIYYLKKDSALNIEEEKTKTKQNPHVLKAIIYIKKHYAEKITLETLGNLTGYTPNHFQRLFTEATGISPQKFIEKTRIRQAKFLLSKGEKELAEISYECGFSSQSYFTTLFKKETLLTPKEYRNATLSSYPD